MTSDFQMTETVHLSGAAFIEGYHYRGELLETGQMKVGRWEVPSGTFDVLRDPTPKVDLVNHPPHYNFGSFEVIDILDESFPDDPHLWAATKYLLRAKHKGNEKQDLEKALFFIQRRINCLT